MKDELRWSTWILIPLVLVLGAAAGLRAGYLAIAADNGWRDAALRVQGDGPLVNYPEGTAFRERTPPTELNHLAANVADHHWFGSLAPLADEEELTAHVAPGFPWLVAIVSEYAESPDLILRWLNVVLGSLTAGCYFFFARRAFHNTFIATLAGLLAACHPYWIINTAELNDGVLVSFLLGLCLMFGARGSQIGGPFTGLLFGLALAGLIMVRGALLPFAIVALLWFLWECRRHALGWFVGFLALIGVINGLVPWGVRNYQLSERPVPVANSAYLHLWMGNNKDANGSTLNESDLRKTLGEARVTQLLKESNQTKRYQLLAHDVWREVEEHPTETMARRFKSGAVFAMGEHWFNQGQLADVVQESDTVAAPPTWVTDYAELALHGTLLGVFVLALLGWRFSHAWNRHGRIAAIAFVWVPLPYILSHAEVLAGPRLPLDGVLLCYAAYALACFVPGLVDAPDASPADP